MRRMLFSAAFTLSILLLVAWGLSRDTAPPATAGLEILGNRDLRAAGDTATWCALATMADGTLRLGRSVLLVAATSLTAVTARRVSDDAPSRCAPLLRARGIRRTLPLIDNHWDTHTPLPRPPSWRGESVA